MNTKPLLTLLADGQVHSGESLAESLGISRTAIWKQVRRLQEEGVEVVTIRGRGYRVAKPMDLLSAEEILSGVGGDWAQRLSLMVHDQIDSTNSDISRRWQAGEEGVLVSIADTQSQGRGRRGRSWQSPIGQNVYMSIGFSIARGFTELDGLSLVAGLGAVDALEEIGVQKAALKWPNDVLINRQKLAGVLIELQGELEGAVRIILGIGINVHMSESGGVDQPWTSLALSHPEADWHRNRVAARVLVSILDHVGQFEVAGFSAFQERWNRYDAFLGESLVATTGDLEGKGLGVDATGAYLLDGPQGLRRIQAGEISLRVAR